jgi:hypothetical protein
MCLPVYQYVYLFTSPSSLYLTLRLKETNAEKSNRHKLFSYSIGNLMKSDPDVMQTLFEGDSLARLKGLMKILAMANNSMRSSLSAEEVYTETARDRHTVRQRTKA